MKDLEKITFELCNFFDKHPNLVEADLTKGTICEALKYNLINLDASFYEFVRIAGQDSAFLNVFAMLSRAAQESTATVLYLASKNSKTHKKYCDDLSYNGQLLHYLYHSLEDDDYAVNTLSNDKWSWTTSSYQDRILKILGPKEYAFYQYSSALAHHAMPNDYFIRAHLEDFSKLRDMLLFKICKYIFLNIKEILKLKCIPSSDFLLAAGVYVEKAQEILDVDNELDRLLELMIFKPHKH